jgi:hypothetical protein
MSDVVESTVEILTALAASGSLQVEEIDSTAKAIYQALKNLDPRKLNRARSLRCPSAPR